MTLFESFDYLGDTWFIITRSFIETKRSLLCPKGTQTFALTLIPSRTTYQEHDPNTCCQSSFNSLWHGFHKVTFPGNIPLSFHGDMIASCNCFSDLSELQK